MLWIKTFHILGVISWLAGIFYLPRIFVHYKEGIEVGQDVQRVAIMADKLFRFMTIMSLFALGLGIWLWLGYDFRGAWMHAKLLFVAVLILYHFVCWQYLKQVRSGDLIKSSVFFRWFNEVALLIVVPILIFVVVKPF